MKNQMKPKLRLLEQSEDQANGGAKETASRRGAETPRQGSASYDLVVDDLTAAAREVQDTLVCCSHIFDRGAPTMVIGSPDGGPPKAIPLTSEQIVLHVHRLRRPVKKARDGRLLPTTLPSRVARMSLAMTHEWKLPSLVGITTAPLLAADGTIRAAEGYDRETRLWCASVPTLQVPEFPRRADAEAALRLLRETFRTFPFTDAPRRTDPKLGIDVVNLDLPPGLDESAFLVGLLTAVCRPHLPLAPGLLIRAPAFSGSGTGKGMLVRSICAIAFGVSASPFTGGDRQELDKRLEADFINAEQVVWLDNSNRRNLESEFLASAMTERSVKVRLLGRSRMEALNSTAFVLVTGNGVTLSEDLVRRFIVCELDARCENPERRAFEGGFSANVEANRAKLLAAALTIWRYGRQNTRGFVPGRPLGSYDDWAQWCRDPLVALGCCDPVERIDRIKADDPSRRQVVDLFNRWHACHGSQPMRVTELVKSVTAIIDPRRRGQQHVVTRLTQLTGTCAGGFILTQQSFRTLGTGHAYIVRQVPVGVRSGDSCHRDDTDDVVAAVTTPPASLNAGMESEHRGQHEAIGLAPGQENSGSIMIDLGRGRRIHVNRHFDAETLERVLNVLDRQR
jgi:putative DNA primase/helicase